MGGEKSALQGSGLVRAVGPCAQRRVALMPRAIEMHCRMINAKAPHISRALLSRRWRYPPSLDRSERRGLFFVIPVSSSVATFEQSENVAIAGASAVACYEGCGLCNRFNLRMRKVLFAQAGYCVCMNYVSMFYEHVLLIDDHAC